MIMSYFISRTNQSDKTDSNARHKTNLYYMNYFKIDQNYKKIVDLQNVRTVGIHKMEFFK